MMKTWQKLAAFLLMAMAGSVQAHPSDDVYAGQLALQELRAGTLVLSWGGQAVRACLLTFSEADASCRIDIVKRDGPVEDGSGAPYRSFTISERSGEQSFPAPARTDTQQTLTATMWISVPSRGYTDAIIHVHHTIPALPEQPPTPPTPPEPPEPPNPPEPETPESVSCRMDYGTVYVPQLPRDAILRIINDGNAGDVTVTVYGGEGEVGPYTIPENGIATDMLQLEPATPPRWARFDGEAGMKLTVLVRKHLDGVRTFFPTMYRERCE